ncbi:MAG: sugar phosphate isomerase/epimerase [Acidobacteria bacterium]|nr:sugar phosphate isomerase/epimerase [Acidobacteriota bacterium]
MKQALSTHLFVNQKLTTATLDAIERAGIAAIEIFCAKQHFDYTDESQVDDLAAWFADHPLELRSLHTPMYKDYSWGRTSGSALNIAEAERHRRLESVEEIKRALDVAERIPFRYLVQHLGVAHEKFELAKFDAAYASLEPLLVYAKQRGVQILLENIPNELSTGEKLRHFLTYTRLNDLRVCFDSGHAHISNGVEPEFEALRDLVLSTHLHDNGGERDDHLFPGQGTIEWDAAIRALSQAPHDFPLQLELRDHGEFKQPLEKALEVFARFQEFSAATRPAQK